MCKTDENIIKPETRKVILTSSTLFNIWTINDLKFPIHVDLDSIVGGSVTSTEL